MKDCKEYHLGVIHVLLGTFSSVWEPQDITGVWDTRKGAAEVVALKGGGTSQK